MEEAIEFIREWNSTYNMGMIKITDISYKYPEAAGDRLFVRGSESSRNGHAIVCHDYERFNRYVEAIRAYNEEMAREVTGDLTDEHEVDTLRRKIAAAEELLANLKCCGNCSHYHSDYDAQCLNDYADWHECCDHWQYDGLTAKQREQIK